MTGLLRRSLMEPYCYSDSPDRTDNLALSPALRQLVTGHPFSQAYDRSVIQELTDSTVGKEKAMVDVRKMVYLMVLPVFTALVCWAVVAAL